jgi:hypothetical protein
MGMLSYTEKTLSYTWLHYFVEIVLRECKINCVKGSKFIIDL